jgi:hypothetical protein
MRWEGVTDRKRKELIENGIISELQHGMPNAVKVLFLVYIMKF